MGKEGLNVTLEGEVAGGHLWERHPSVMGTRPTYRGPLLGALMDRELSPRTHSHKLQSRCLLWGDKYLPFCLAFKDQKGGKILPA